MQISSLVTALLPDLDRAEPHLVAVILQEDVTLVCFAEAGEILVFALLHQLPVGLTSTLIFENLEPVEPVLDVTVK
jgi:hypothetical protein